MLPLGLLQHPARHSLARLLAFPVVPSCLLLPVSPRISVSVRTSKYMFWDYEGGGALISPPFMSGRTSAVHTNVLVLVLVFVLAGHVTHSDKD